MQMKPIGYLLMNYQHTHIYIYRPIKLGGSGGDITVSIFEDSLKLIFLCIKYISNFKQQNTIGASYEYIQ